MNVVYRRNSATEQVEGQRLQGLKGTVGWGLGALNREGREQWVTMRDARG